jgi:hypothetical protein
VQLKVVACAAKAKVAELEATVSDSAGPDVIVNPN